MAQAVHLKWLTQHFEEVFWEGYDTLLDDADAEGTGEALRQELWLLECGAD